MNWWIIIILIAIAFLFLRFRHMKHKVYLILLIVVLLFFYVTGTQILSDHEVDWTSVSSIGGALKTYFSWMGSVGGNFKSITGNALKLDWKLNETEST